MAKKKSAKPTQPVSDAPTKTRVELRFDNDVYANIKRLADEADISVNQLMHGLARWAGTLGRAGEPERDAEGIVRNKRQPGCVWFGTLGWKLDEIDDPDWYQAVAQDYDGPEQGRIDLRLDFTERHVVRDDDEKRG